MRRTHAPNAAAVVIAAFLCSECSSAPTLNAVVPATGYPRQLLAVQGTTFGASVVWDAGSASELLLPSGLFGTQYFQVPQGATPGPHKVALRNDSGTSATTTVTVLPPAPDFPMPRIEDIGILSMSGPGPVDVLMTVSAANLDVDASVLVEELGPGRGTRNIAAAVMWGGLPIDYLQAHDPTTFGYPVYHYAQQLFVVEGVTLGAKLHIKVTNSDGKIGETDFLMPPSTADLDSDGDGLLNSWEETGYPAPSGVNISLASLGTNVWRKDVLVEVDMTTNVSIHADLWTEVEQAFRDAPVLNPDGSAGIAVIIDRGQGGALTNGGQELPDHDCLTFDDPAPPPPAGCTTLVSFFDYKQDHFDSDRLRLFHYAVWGNKQLGPSTGNAERWGNDFFVTLGRSGAAATLLTLQLGTFLHEFGHNLGLSHGNLFLNTENYDFKVNLPSVMNYRYQVTGVDVDCDLIGDNLYTYSQGTLRTLSETLVNETSGVCDNHAVNLDMNPAIGAGPMNLNGFPGVPGSDADMLDEWHDFDQWGRLLLNFTSPDSLWDED